MIKALNDTNEPLNVTIGVRNRRYFTVTQSIQMPSRPFYFDSWHKRVAAKVDKRKGKEGAIFDYYGTSQWRRGGCWRSLADLSLDGIYGLSHSECFRKWKHPAGGDVDMCYSRR